ncbi:hypothetical protein ACHAWF_011070 [Thalassiosira exigua]
MPLATKACYDLDEELKNDASRPRDGGTTAVFALVGDEFLLVANVGDSRCILVRKGASVVGEGGDAPSVEVVALSEDHRPDLPEERARIESAGLSVQTDRVPPSEEGGAFTSVHRVKKSDTELLGVSRAFGDHDYKSNAELSPSRQAVTCAPEFVARDRDDGTDLYLVLACDGVWDAMSNEDVGEFVAERVATFAKEEAVGPGEADIPSRGDEGGRVVALAKAGDALLAECLKRGSRDNMSVLIVALPASGFGGGEGGGGPEDAVVASSSTAEGGLEPAARALAYE